MPKCNNSVSDYIGKQIVILAGQYNIMFISFCQISIKAACVYQRHVCVLVKIKIDCFFLQVAQNMLLWLPCFPMSVELFLMIFFTFRYVLANEFPWTLSRPCKCIHGIVKLSSMRSKFHHGFKAHFLILPIIQLMLLGPRAVQYI